MIDREKLEKQQREWLQEFQLTDEQVKKLISNKVERRKMYSNTMQKKRENIE